jgi:hypothetical protein
VGAWVGFSGSRSLSARFVPLVKAVVLSVARSGRGVAVGDAAGADAFVREEVRVLGAGARVRVPLRVFRPESAAVVSWCPCFRVEQPRESGRFAKGSGKTVVSFARPSSVQVVTRRVGGRTPAGLAMRSSAMVRFAAGSGAGAGLVAFVGAACPRFRRGKAGRRKRSGRELVPSRSQSRCFGGFGSGTWSSVALAVGLGLPVVVFLCGVGREALPSWWAGTWVPCSGSGVWAQGWRFVPSQALALGLARQG